MLKEAVKTALRLGETAGNTLSGEVERNIEVARAEMVRAGVPASVAESEHKLIENAIVTYCLMTLGNKELYERYKESWEYQVDNLRKSRLESEDV